MSETTTVEDNDFGVPGEGEAQRRNFKDMYIKLEMGTNVIQLCPGTKSLRKTGKWAKYWALHWGYRMQLENEDKTVARPFVCVEEKSFKNNIATVTRECPECSYIEGIKQKIEKKTVELKDKNKTKEEIKAALKPLTEVLGKDGHQTERKYYAIARTASGQWGILKMGSRLYKAIDTKIKEAAGKGVNLLDPNKCVWWQIERSGKDFDTTYTATIMQEADMATGGLRPKTSSITETDRVEIRSLPDLMEINARSIITPAQVASIVESGGDPSVVARVFGSPQTQQAPAPEQTHTAAVVARQVSETPAPKTQVVETPKAPPTVSTPSASSMSQREMLLASGVDPSVIDALFSNG